MCAYAFCPTSDVLEDDSLTTFSDIRRSVLYYSQPLERGTSDVGQDDDRKTPNVVCPVTRQT